MNALGAPRVPAGAAANSASLRRRKLTLRDIGTRQSVLGRINAMIVGNYLTTLGRSAQEDLDLLAELKTPVKELSKTL